MKEGRFHSGRNIFRTAGRYLAVVVLLYVVLATSLSQLHDQAHAEQGDSHKDCVICLILAGSVEMPDFPFGQVTALGKVGKIEFCPVALSLPSQMFWSVMAARPPPTVS